MLDARLLVRTVFAGLDALEIEAVEDDDGAIRVRARTRNREVACPSCGTTTKRLHAYHERVPTDVPVNGRPVQVQVRVRRLKCAVDTCLRGTFREQVPGLLERYQRRTVRLAKQIGQIVRELAGRASARALAAIGVQASKDTAVRTLLRLPAADHGRPASVGHR